MKCLNYPIYLTDGYGKADAGSSWGDGLAGAYEAAGLAGRHVCVVTDENVSRLYLEEVCSNLDGLGKVSKFAIPAGEIHKNLRTVESIYGAFVKYGLDRKSSVLALGGGVVGDMAGFAASTYMRGIQFAQAPTTLLAQVDASVGGKLGVDFMGLKNLVGVFCQPAFVYINSKTLDTLPSEQFSSGMGEVVKHGLALDAQYYSFLKKSKEKILNREPFAIKAAIEGSCRIKSEVVAQDEKESGLRERLNFGHTFGHAVESLLDFSLPHGHCVSIGMAAALRMSLQNGAISLDELNEAESLLSFFDLPVRVDLDPEKVYEQMKLDKKNKGGAINIVLLTRVGESHTCPSPCKNAVMEAIRGVCAH
jgi:3-dehydroquinate synthase